MTDSVYRDEYELFQGVIGRTWDESTPDWPERVKPPAGAPNVLLVVLDDTGFSHLGCYGSTISTPNIDRLAAQGLRFSNFHTTALCSPTRASLLTGRNHHATGISCVTEAANGFPNNRGRISKQTGMLSEILRERGYNTFAVGKWHLLPVEEQTSAGPFDGWPLGRGFEHYYGFLSGETSQWNPELVMDNQRIQQPRRAEDGYHLTEDLIDRAIGLLRDQRTVAPDRPFLCYLALGATHAPHHAPRAFIERYKGKFDEGWDHIRESWFQRQKELGIIPADTQLPPSNPDVRPWDELDTDEKHLFARMQEIFAGYLEHTDYHFGRLLRALEELGQMDNTIILLLSDNGASAEGGPNGTDNEWRNFNGIELSVPELLERIDDLGSYKTYNHYPAGWAQAGNAPLKWYKSWVHAGGVKDPLIIRYPPKIRDQGGIRHQYHHVTDITPTILELIGIEAPATLHGIAQKPLHGTSLAYTFAQSDGPTRKEVQYYEMIGHRAIWHDGWKAVTNHQPSTPFEEDQWELYHVAQDFSEVHNLAQERPEKLRELIDRWWVEAGRYEILPLDDRPMMLRAATRVILKTLSRPTHYTYYPFIAGLHAIIAPDVRNKSYVFTAGVERPDERSEGVLVAYGGRFGGYSFFVHQNRLFFDYNFVGLAHYTITSQVDVPTGPSVLQFAFAKTGDFQGTGKLYIDGAQVGEGIIAQTAPMVAGPGFFDVGQNTLTPVSPLYESPFRFSGTLQHVTVDLESHDFDPALALALEMKTE